MKYIRPFLSGILLVTFLASVFVENATSADYTCYLKSKTAILHVSVYNFLPTEMIGKRIWKGILKENQQVLLESKFGRIYYEYSTKPGEYSSIGFIRSCKEKETFILQ